jgi:hypothetical protein
MRQDWAAAAVELTIVVLGIFLGLQAADWNERRIGAREEESIQATKESAHRMFALHSKAVVASI